MDLLVSFVVFIAAMAVCLVIGVSMVIALVIGLIAFSLCALHRGFAISDVLKMEAKGLKDARIVVELMFIIGFLTATWRTSGTIAFFVYYGIKIITPSMFLIITFLLTCVLSYAIGTSFGVAGTVGVIFMALARAGDVNEIITAGVIMSGIYFGDRGSPVSSSAVLVAGITKTNLLDNVRNMMKTGAVPLIICFAVYAVLSLSNPIHTVDPSLMNALTTEFQISLWCLIPAICVLVLPLLKVDVLYAMLASVVSGMVISIAVQHMVFTDLFKAMITGFTSKTEAGVIFNGGGMVSMIEIVIIVGLSSTYSGLFNGTKMLESLQEKISSLMKKIGRFPTTVILSMITLMIFCNQTIASMMCNDVLQKPYLDSGANSKELAIDLENSVILLAGIVPWAIACSVPLQFMQVGYKAVLLAFFLYLTPLVYGIQKKVSNPFAKE